MTPRLPEEDDMRTCDVMSSPVVSVPPGAPLKDVAATLVRHGINAVPVVDATDRLIGIVSEADLLSLGTGPGRGPAGAGPRTAGEVMRQSVYTLTGDTDAAAAARLMLRHRLKSVPVMAGERVVGMVARRDLLRLIARSDHDIQADLDRRLKEEILALQRLAVSVTGGVVTIDAAASPLARQLLEGLARTVPGVVEVRTTQRGADGAEPPRGTNGDR
jgi:CBS domain-containing protein